jgi:phosphoribosylanthranilate isomerase
MKLENLVIKVCGITSVEDARAMVEAGVDWIGLNMHQQSPRSLTLEKAEEIQEAVGEKVKIILLTVDESANILEHWVKVLRPDWIQFHLDGISEKRLKSWPSFQAIRMKEEADIVRAKQTSGPFVLVDSYDAKLQGGSGKTLPWKWAEEVAASRATMLAGGLNADNVAEAIHAVKPMGVDVASGVEKAPGEKDFQKVCAFVAEARRAHGEVSERNV